MKKSLHSGRKSVETRFLLVLSDAVLCCRIYGLLRSGAMQETERPLWYDVYAAFPPRIEPKYDRFVADKKPVNILYHEDAVRA